MSIGQQSGYQGTVTGYGSGGYGMGRYGGAEPIGDGNPPNDIDNDGSYEDVNGDGEFTIVDVQLLFSERNSGAVRNSSARFDFNDDGRFTIADIQRLFSMLKEK